MSRILTTIFALVAICGPLTPPAFSDTSKVGSPLPVEQEAKLRKATKAVRSGKPSKAAVKCQAALDSASDVAQCLAVAEATEKYGAPLMDVRRACLQKALTLGKNRDDFFQIALKARQYQFYEVTKSAIDFVIANANSDDELFDMAQKAQELGLSDLARMAMDKDYLQIKTVPDAILFAKRAEVLNMHDVVRKTIKDLIDDEPTTMGLCNLFNEVEPFQIPDLERYLLRRAVYAVKSVGDCKEVFEIAKKHGQPDIANLAAYRGRKMIQMQQSQDATTQTVLQAQEQQAANDLAKKHHNYVDGPGF
ncbi:MAG: hypothetical protein C5B53_08095 [Candidatus Melainabacteria bacterium]|nr:MAG: hypothetical protein C5B53_08095 [Candidatus Melainabacteria bacterium]